MAFNFPPLFFQLFFHFFFLFHFLKFTHNNSPCLSCPLCLSPEPHHWSLLVVHCTVMHGLQWIVCSVSQSDWFWWWWRGGQAPHSLLGEGTEARHWAGGQHWGSQYIVLPSQPVCNLSHSRNGWWKKDCEGRRGRKWGKREQVDVLLDSFLWLWQMRDQSGLETQETRCQQYIWFWEISNIEQWEIFNTLSLWVWCWLFDLVGPLLWIKLLWVQFRIINHSWVLYVLVECS